MKPLSLAPMLIILASHQASAQSPQNESSKRGYLGVQLMTGALVGNTESEGPAMKGVHSLTCLMSPYKD
jgi:hypothetical protein